MSGTNGHRDREQFANAFAALGVVLTGMLTLAATFVALYFLFREDAWWGYLLAVLVIALDRGFMHGLWASAERDGVRRPRG